MNSSAPESLSTSHGLRSTVLRPCHTRHAVSWPLQRLQQVSPALARAARSTVFANPPGAQRREGWLPRHDEDHPTPTVCPGENPSSTVQQCATEAPAPNVADRAVHVALKGPHPSAAAATADQAQGSLATHAPAVPPATSRAPPPRPSLQGGEDREQARLAGIGPDAGGVRFGAGGAAWEYMVGGSQGSSGEEEDPWGDPGPAFGVRGEHVRDLGGFHTAENEHSAYSAGWGQSTAHHSTYSIQVEGGEGLPRHGSAARADAGAGAELQGEGVGGGQLPAGERSTCGSTDRVQGGAAGLGTFPQGPLLARVMEEGDPDTPTLTPVGSGQPAGGWGHPAEQVPMRPAHLPTAPVPPPPSHLGPPDDRHGSAHGVKEHPLGSSCATSTADGSASDHAPANTTEPGRGHDQGVRETPGHSAGPQQRERRDGAAGAGRAQPEGNSQGTGMGQVRADGPSPVEAAAGARCGLEALQRLAMYGPGEGTPSPPPHGLVPLGTVTPRPARGDGGAEQNSEKVAACEEPSGGKVAEAVRRLQGTPADGRPRYEGQRGQQRPQRCSNVTEAPSHLERRGTGSARGSVPTGPDPQQKGHETWGMAGPSEARPEVGASRAAAGVQAAAVRASQLPIRRTPSQSRTRLQQEVRAGVVSAGVSCCERCFAVSDVLVP